MLRCSVLCLSHEAHTAPTDSNVSFCKLYNTRSSQAQQRPLGTDGQHNLHRNPTATGVPAEPQRTLTSQATTLRMKEIIAAFRSHVRQEGPFVLYKPALSLWYLPSGAPLLRFPGRNLQQHQARSSDTQDVYQRITHFCSCHSPRSWFSSQQWSCCPPTPRPRKSRCTLHQRLAPGAQVA